MEKNIEKPEPVSGKVTFSDPAAAEELVTLKDPRDQVVQVDREHLIDILKSAVIGARSELAHKGIKLTDGELSYQEIRETLDDMLLTAEQVRDWETMIERLQNQEGGEARGD